MTIFLSFDYEIFFKSNNSSTNESLIIPTIRLLQILDRYNIKGIFFVDAGYLYALERQKMIKDVALEQHIVTEQVKTIEYKSHEIGLHIHPHWEDTYYENKKWKMNLNRYKLSDFKKDEVKSIFRKYHYYLNKNINGTLRSYRAGGWCIDPFENIRESMIEYGIKIDSTVFGGGYRKSRTHYYDYRTFPKKEIWKFKDNPIIENSMGDFIEVPINATSVSSKLFWNIIYKKTKIFFKKKRTGQGIRPPMKEIIRSLLSKSIMPVTLDSVKSKYLMKSFIEKEKTGDKYFSIISHPKCLTEVSFEHLDEFIQYALKKGHVFSTYKNAFDIEKSNLSKEAILQYENKL